MKRYQKSNHLPPHYSIHLTPRHKDKQIKIVLALSLIFMMAPCWQHGFQQQQSEDTLSFPPSHEVKPAPRVVPLPLLPGLQAIRHTHTLLKILDTQNNPFSLNRNVLFLFPQPLLSELRMMSPFSSVGSSTRQLLTVTLQFITDDIKRSCSFLVLRFCVSYLKASVGTWVAEVVVSPWFRRGVHRYPLEVRGHTVSPRKLEYAHGDWTLLPGDRKKVKGHTNRTLTL